MKCTRKDAWNRKIITDDSYVPCLWEITKRHGLTTTYTARDDRRINVCVGRWTLSKNLYDWFDMISSTPYADSDKVKYVLWISTLRTDNVRFEEECYIARVVFWLAKKDFDVVIFWFSFLEILTLVFW